MGEQFIVCLVLVALVPTSLGQLYPSWPDPPAYTSKALYARYLMHYATWGTVSGISPEHGHMPYGTLQSISDGPLDHSTGTPYFYMAEISDTYINMQYNNTMSLALSLAQSEHCKKSKLDPMDPPCGRMTAVGKMVRVEDKEEQKFAKKSLFSRHPTMNNWPSGHEWHFYKLKLTGIYLIDFFGGAADISMTEYYNTNPVKKFKNHRGQNNVRFDKL